MVHSKLMISNLILASWLFMSVSYAEIWYREDFEQGWLGVNSVSEFLARYANEIELTENGLSQLEQKDIRIRYLRYDWKLNGEN